MGAGTSTENASKEMSPLRVPDKEDDCPLPKPPITRKHEVFKPDDYAHIDNHAKSVPAKHWTYSGLLDQLFVDLKSDMQMVRAIFVWLGSQNVEQLRLGNVTDPTTPVGYMKLIQRGQGSYAAFFAQICRAAKIPCVVIRGKGKAVGYEVGDQDISNLKCKWTAVHVGQQWRLIHPLWAFTGVQGQASGKWTLIEKKGQGHRRKEGESKGSDIRTCDDFFFLTDPDQFVWFCRADEEPWQLLDKPISEQEFLDSPCYTPAYFTSGLKYIGDSGSLVANEGKEALRFEHAKDKNMNISYELYCDEEDSEEQLPDSTDLERYVLENTQKTKKSLFLRFPVAGVYKLRVFGGTGSEKNLPHIADYRIKCNKEAKNPNPFPLQKDIGYGYGHEAKDAGLVTTSAYSGIVVLEHGQKMTFNFDVDRSVEFQTKLHHRSMTPYELENYLESEVTNKNAEVTVTMPEEGLTTDSEYALEINTREKDSHDSFRNVCNYFLTPDKKQWKADSDAVARAVVKPQGRPVRTQTKIQQKQARSESPRRRMRYATGGDDMDDLDRKIQEFEKSGLDEKDKDYTKAKERLVKLRNDANRDETPRYRMRDATSGDSIEDLERTIDDFENSDLDEKDRDLTKAKERLAELKRKKEEEDAIRKRMRDATDEDDIDDLEKSIEAFEAAGVDERDRDLTLAKERLAKLKNDAYQEPDKEDESAREAMRDATDYGSADELEKAIKDFENSGLDEKDRDYTRAKERLAQLKDQENKPLDNGEEEMLRRKLADALDGNDMDTLNDALQECKAAGLEDKGDISEAERRLMEMHRDKLEEAKRARDAEQLQRAIEDAEQSAVADKLDRTDDLEDAKITSEQIKRVKKFNQQVLELNPRLVSEIASYKRPKPCIHDVMTATYIILNDKPKDGNWQSIVKRMKSIGQKNIIRRVGNFDIVDVTPEQAEAAGKLIEPYDMEDVKRNSRGAGTFYKWTRDVVKEVKNGGSEE